MNRNELTTLFICQSQADSESDYYSSLSSESAPHFNVIAITASNEHQAEGFRQQLAVRKLPPFTEFVVIPDKNGERVGSGGATLSVIKYVKEKYGSFKGISIACLHSGGDSKRIPNYSALGKLFSPVPRILPNGKPSTLFDEFMISIASVPGRMREGMLLLSGDVLLMFNPLQIDYSGHGAAAISFKESVNTGKEHGAFLKGENGYVKKFLHKQTEESLRSVGAVDERGNVAIDTGAVIFAPEMLEDLYSMVSTKEDEDRYINPVTRLSLYGDFLYPLAEDSTLEAFYDEKPEGEFCDELRAAREVLWGILRKYRMKLLNLAPSRFIHFGTIGEVMQLMNEGYRDFEELGWRSVVNSSVPESIPAYCSVASPKAKIGKRCYLEYSYIHSGVTVGDNVLLSFIEVEEGNIPSNTVVHLLKQSNGKFICRVFPTDSNPKAFWNELRYPECGTVKEALKTSLDIYNGIISADTAQSKSKGLKLVSLASGFNNADSKAIQLWERRMEDYVRMEEIASMIKSSAPARETKGMLENRGLAIIQQQWLDKQISRLNISDLEDFGYLARLYYYVGIASGDSLYTEKCFNLIAEVVNRECRKKIKYNHSCKIIKDSCTVKLPLRVNWGGGWSDTCPHCLENGGTVLNVAVALDGKDPITVTVKKLSEHKVIFDSVDMEAHGEFTEIDELQNTGDPFDSFALQKACIVACGIIPDKESGINISLEDVLARMGGGFEMDTEVVNVPKGSGLGTSSILAAATVKAMLEFVGSDCSESDLYTTVLNMEQIMSTGGGWQDQIGGLLPGIKFITSEPGIYQNIKVEHVKLSRETEIELDSRFALIYTGQRRLARNLLRDVVGRYLGNEPDSLYAHNEIQKTAVLMKYELERGNVDGFAQLLDYHWGLSQKIDAGSTNTLIDQIFLVIDDLVDARMCCGAGGGGFLQIMLKKGVTKEQVHERLKDVFQDFEVDVWPSSIQF